MQGNKKSIDYDLTASQGTADQAEYLPSDKGEEHNALAKTGGR